MGIWSSSSKCCWVKRVGLAAVVLPQSSGVRHEIGLFDSIWTSITCKIGAFGQSPPRPSPTIPATRQSLSPARIFAQQNHVDLLPFPCQISPNVRISSLARPHKSIPGRRACDQLLSWRYSQIVPITDLLITAPMLLPAGGMRTMTTLLGSTGLVDDYPGKIPSSLPGLIALPRHVWIVD